MKINYIQENLRKITYEEDLPEYMTEKHAEDIAEVFHTPLQGTYNWDYRIQDNRIKRLYELGKELNWNVEMDICLLYTSPSPRDVEESRMPSSA